MELLSEGLTLELLGFSLPRSLFLMWLIALAHTEERTQRSAE